MWDVLCTKFFAMIGAAIIAYKLVEFVLWIKTQFFTKADLKKYTEAGDWSIVTGASDGIGKAFSIELARRGFNVALVSRTKDKLEAVAEQVHALGKKSLVLPFDFANASKQDYKKLFEALEPLSVGVLINNVGMCYDYPRFFEDVNIDDDATMLRVNCESQLQMTKFVAPRMKQAHCGAIISVSSISSIGDVAMFSTYASTKAFIRHFSRCMQVELEPHGIDVMVVMPYYVISNMSKKRRESYNTISADKFVITTLDQLGTLTETMGHWKHTVFKNLISCLPLPMRNESILDIQMTAAKKAQARAAAKISQCNR